MRMFGQRVEDGVKVIVIIQTKATVSEVVFQGVTKFKVEKIRKEMKVKPGSTLDEANLEVDRQKILDMYTDKGYANTTVSYKEDPSPDGSVRVTYIVNEASKMVITKITFEGNTAFKDKILRKQIKSRTQNILSFITKDGKVDSDKMDDDVAGLRDYYQDHGYVDVDISSPTSCRSARTM